MQSLGYKKVSKSFLVKNFGNLQINITRRNGYVESITGYNSNNEVTQMSNDILTQVQGDIQQSL